MALPKERLPNDREIKEFVQLVRKIIDKTKQLKPKPPGGG